MNAVSEKEMTSAALEWRCMQDAGEASHSTSRAQRVNKHFSHRKYRRFLSKFKIQLQTQNKFGNFWNIIKITEAKLFNAETFRLWTQNAGVDCENKVVLIAELYQTGNAAKESSVIKNWVKKADNRLYYCNTKPSHFSGFGITGIWSGIKSQIGRNRK